MRGCSRFDISWNFCYIRIDFMFSSIGSLIAELLPYSYYMRKLFALFLCLCPALCLSAQNDPVEYSYIQEQGVHIVTLQEPLTSNYMGQEAIYDIQFQYNKAKRLFLAINIAQTGSESYAMQLSGMYPKNTQGMVRISLSNKQFLGSTSASILGDKVISETGDTIGVLYILVPLDKIYSTDNNLVRQSPDSIRNYAIDKLASSNILVVRVNDKDFYMQNTSSVTAMRSLLSVLQDKTGVSLLTGTYSDNPVSPTRIKRNMAYTSYNNFRNIFEAIKKYGACRLTALSINYGGAMVFGNGGFSASGKMPADFATYLRVINGSRKYIEEINIAENGAFVIVYNYYEYFANGIPDNFAKALSNVSVLDHIYSACFNVKGDWAIVSKKEYVASPDIMKHLDAAKKQYGKPKHCFFTDNGISIICAKGVYTHNVPEQLLKGLQSIPWKPKTIKFTDNGHYVITNDSEKCHYNL